MSRSFGATWLTTRLPMRTSPPEISSRPAIMRSSVLLPQPEGPTRTQNSPSSIVTSTPWTTSVLPNDLRTALRVTAAMGALVYLGVGHRRGTLEEIEVAAFVGLLDVLAEDRAVAPFVFPWRGLPAAFPLLQFLGGDLQVQFALFDVQFDEIAVPDESQRSADKGFRGDVQDAGAVAGAAHARVRQAHHVAHPLLEELLRHRQHAPFGHARAAERPGVAQHQHRVGVDLEVVAIDARRHVVVVLEYHGFPGVLEQLRRG